MPAKIELAITGMICANYVWAVEQTLSKTQGIVSVEVCIDSSMTILFSRLFSHLWLPGRRKTWLHRKVVSFSKYCEAVCA